MTDRTISADPPARAADLHRTPDEWSMRLMELGVAGIALVAALLLTIVR